MNKEAKRGLILDSKGSNLGGQRQVKAANLAAGADLPGGHRGPQIKQQIMRSKEVAAKAPSPEQRRGGPDDGPEKVAKFSRSAFDSHDKMNQTQPLKLQPVGFGAHDPLTQQHSTRHFERQDEAVRKSMDSGQVEMSDEQLRPVGHPFQQQDNLASDSGQQDVKEQRLEGVDPTFGGGLGRAGKKKSAVLTKQFSNLEKSPSRSPMSAPRLRIQVHGHTGPGSKQAGPQHEGLASIQQTDTEDNSELALVSSEGRHKQKNNKPKELETPSAAITGHLSEEAISKIDRLKDYTKYLDERLNKNTNVYKPPIVEKQCLSAFSIKPTAKEDVQAKMKDIQAKYNITKVRVVGKHILPITHQTTNLRNSYNLKSLQTFEKVESLLNLNQQSHLQLAAAEDYSVGRHGSKDALFNGRPPEPQMLSTFAQNDDVLGRNGYTRATQSVSRSLRRADALRASLNQSAELQNPEAVGVQVFPNMSSSKTKQTVRPSSSGPGTSIMMHHGLSASFNQSRQSMRDNSRKGQPLRSSPLARVCYNNMADNLLSRQQETLKDKLNIMSNETDLASMAGIQPAGALLLSNKHTEEGRHPQSSSIYEDETVEPLDHSLSPTSFVYSGQGVRHKEGPSMQTFGRRSINKTLISMRNYDGYTVPRQPNYKRKEKRRYSPIRVMDGDQNRGIAQSPETMMHDDFEKRDSHRSELSGHDKQAKMAHKSFDEHEKESQHQASALALRPSLPEKIDLKEQQWPRSASIDEPQTALIIRDPSSSSRVPVTRRKTADYRADDIFNEYEQIDARAQRDVLDSLDLLASDLKRDKSRAQSTPAGTEAVDGVTAKSKPKRDRDLNRNASPLDRDGPETLRPLGEMGIQGTRMQFLEIDKLARKKMMDEMQQANSTKHSRYQRMVLHTPQASTTTHLNDQQTTKRRNRKGQSDVLEGKAGKRRKCNIVANAVPGAGGLHQPVAPLKEHHSPDNTMLASFQGSQKSQSHSPLDSNAVSRNEALQDLPFGGSPSTKKIIDIVRKGDRRIEALQEDTRQSADEYLIQTQQQEKESKQTQPTFESQLARRPPMRHTLKKHSKTKADDAQRQKRDRQRQQEKIQQAKARRHCRSRESTYIKRQKILSANPARNRSVAQRQKLQNAHLERHAKARTANATQLQMNSKDLKDVEALAEKENRRLMTSFEQAHCIPYGVILPSTQAQKEEQGRETPLGVSQWPGRSQHSRDRVDAKKPNALGSNMDIMLDLQMRQNENSDLAGELPKLQDPRKRQRKQSFVIYHQAIESQQANFLIVEEASKDKEKDARQNSKSKSDSPASPYGRNYSYSNPRNVRTSNRYMLPFQKYADKIQAKLVADCAQDERSRFAGQKDMLASTGFARAPWKRQAKMRDELEDRVFRIPTPIECTSPDLMSKTNLSMTSPLYSHNSRYGGRNTRIETMEYESHERLREFVNKTAVKEEAAAEGTTQAQGHAEVSGAQPEQKQADVDQRKEEDTQAHAGEAEEAGPDRTNSVHDLDRSRERYLKETRRVAFQQSQKHLKARFHKSNQNLAQKVKIERDCEWQILQHQFGLITEIKAEKANKERRYAALSPSELEMLVVNDSLKVKQMKPEQLSFKAADKASNQVLSDGISFSMLSPPDDQIIHISTRPRTSHLEQNQNNRSTMNQRKSGDRQVTSTMAPETTMAQSKHSRDNLRHFHPDVQSQQYEREAGLIYHSSDANDQRFMNDRSSGALQNAKSQGASVFTNFGTHGFFPTRKQSVILQSTSLSNIRHLNQLKKAKQRRAYLWVGEPGPLTPGAAPSPAAAKDKTAVMSKQEAPAQQLVVAGDKAGLPSPGRQGRRRQDARTQDAQTGVYLINQAFGVEGALLSSQHQDTVNQSSLQAWPQKTSVSPNRSLAIDNELHTAKSIKSIHEGSPSPLSQKLASTLDDRKDVGSLLRDKDNFLPTKNQEMIKIVRHEKLQDAAEAEGSRYKTRNRSPEKIDRLLPDNADKLHRTEVLENFFDEAREEAAGEAVVPSTKCNSRNKSQLAEPQMKSRSTQRATAENSNKNKDLAHLVSKPALRPDSPQMPEDQDAEEPRHGSFGALISKELANGRAAAELHPKPSPSYQKILDERKKIMQIPNEDIDIIGAAPRKRTASQVAAQDKATLRESDPKEDQSQVGEADSLSKKDEPQAEDDHEDYNPQMQYDMKQEEDENSSKVSDLLRSTTVAVPQEKEQPFKAKRNSQISLTIRTKQSSRGKPNISELNVVLPQEAQPEPLQHQPDLHVTAGSRQSDEKVAAGAEAPFPAEFKTAPSVYRCNSPHLSDVEAELMLRITKPSYIHTIRSPKARAGNAPGLLPQDSPGSRANSNLPTHARGRSEAVPVAHQSVQKLSNNDMIPTVPPLSHQRPPRSVLLSPTSPQDKQEFEQIFVNSEGYMKLTNEEREHRHQQLVLIKEHMLERKELNRQKRVKKQEWRQKLRSFLQGLKSTGGILSSKTPQLELIREQNLRKYENAKMLAGKSRNEEQHEELTLQLRDEKGHLTHYKRVIRVRNLQQLMDSKDVEASSQAQTLLGKQLKESSKANGSTPARGQEELRTMALVSKKSDDRHLSELLSVSSAEPASLVGPVHVSPSLVSKDGPMPPYELQNGASRVKAYHLSNHHLPPTSKSNNEHNKQNQMKYEMKPPIVKNIREFKLVYGSQLDGSAIANERNFGQGLVSDDARNPAATQTKMNPPPMLADCTFAGAHQYRQKSATATRKNQANNQRDRSRANFFGVPLAGDKEVVETLNAKQNRGRRIQSLRADSAKVFIRKRRDDGDGQTKPQVRKLTKATDASQRQVVQMKIDDQAKAGPDARLQQSVNVETSGSVEPMTDAAAKATTFSAQQLTKLQDLYEIGELLEIGPFGEVRACTDLSSGARRVVKVLAKSALDAEQTKMVRDEIEYLKDLEHQHLQRIEARFEDENRHYIVMEACSGARLLDEIARRGKFSEMDASVLIKQVLSCLQYCHSKNVILRDLRPENVYLEQGRGPGKIKIVGLGSSLVFGENDELNVRLGAPYQSAPEVQATTYGPKSDTPKVDLWRCGILTNILLSGMPPFSGASEQEILKKAQLGKYSFQDAVWSNVTYDAKDFISQLLTADPGKRPSATQALKHPWIRKASDLPRAMPSPDLALGAFKNLRSFSSRSNMTRAIHSFIMTLLQVKLEAEDLGSLFEEVDEHNSGRLSREAISRSCFDFFGQSFRGGLLDELYAALTADADGKFEYSEFLAAVTKEKHLLVDASLRSTFQAFSKDEHGSVPTSILKNVLACAPCEDAAMLEQILKQIDEGGSTLLTHEEFASLVQTAIEDYFCAWANPVPSP